MWLAVSDTLIPFRSTVPFLAAAKTIALLAMRRTTPLLLQRLVNAAVLDAHNYVKVKGTRQTAFSRDLNISTLASKGFCMVW